MNFQKTNFFSCQPPNLHPNFTSFCPHKSCTKKKLYKILQVVIIIGIFLVRLLYHKVQTRSNKGSYYLFLTSCSISWLHSLEKALRSSRVLGASRLYSDWKENASSRDYVYNSCLIL